MLPDREPVRASKRMQRTYRGLRIRTSGRTASTLPAGTVATVPRLRAPPTIPRSGVATATDALRWASVALGQRDEAPFRRSDIAGPRADQAVVLRLLDDVGRPSRDPAGHE